MVAKKVYRIAYMLIILIPTLLMALLGLLIIVKTAKIACLCLLSNQNAAYSSWALQFDWPWTLCVSMGIFVFGRPTIFLSKKQGKKTMGHFFDLLPWALVLALRVPVPGMHQYQCISFGAPSKITRIRNAPLPLVFSRKIQNVLSIQFLISRTVPMYIFYIRASNVGIIGSGQCIIN